MHYINEIYATHSIPQREREREREKERETPLTATIMRDF